MGANKEEVFEGKTFDNLLKEIYDNQNQKKSQINSLIQELKPLIKDIGDATLLVPLLKGYLDSGLKNDEQLIKMATIIQKGLINNSNGEGGEGGGFNISQEEQDELLKLASEANSDSNGEEEDED